LIFFADAKMGIFYRSCQIFGEVFFLISAKVQELQSEAGEKQPALLINIVNLVMPP
jgi:hypothetical protein